MKTYTPKRIVGKIDRVKFIEAFDTLAFNFVNGQKELTFDSEDYDLPHVAESDDDQQQALIIAVRDSMSDLLSDLLYEFMEFGD